MRQNVRFILPIACLLALLAGSALAREQEQKEALTKAAPLEFELQIEEALKVLRSKFGFETKVVKGAPYSATAEAETVQALADGNHIRTKLRTTVYRDSEGRTRREFSPNKQGLYDIFISDSAAGFNYVLDPQRRVAFKSDMINLKELELEKMKRAYDMKQKTQESGEVVRSDGDGVVMKKKKAKPESLGKQMIEGVECEGTRATVTIPAGAIGNDLPITLVNEQWYSPELQVFVLTKQHDPRVGETTYRLTNINRSEPDRALFDVPAGYTLRDESTLPAKMKRRPEDEQ